MIGNLIRDTSQIANLSSEFANNHQVEDLLGKVKDEGNDEIEEKIRQKSQLLNVAFGSLLHFMKEGNCGEYFANSVGLLHWFS